MASSAISKLTPAEQAQFFYVTYYGRPADPDGLKFWADAISRVGLELVARDFSNSDEAKVKYPGLGKTSDLTQLRTDIQTLYKTVFGRDPLAIDPATGSPYDAKGLNYWVDRVVAGDTSFGQLSIVLYNAAAENPTTQQDVLAIANRQSAAKSFTESLTTAVQKAAYSGQNAVTSLSTWLATVDHRAESLTAAAAAKTDLIFNLVLYPEKPNTASPVVKAASVSVNEDAVVSGAISATDADGTTLIYSADKASAQGGTVTINASTGAFTYTPKANFAGSDSFKVTVSDGQGGVSSSTVNVTVKEVNEVVAKVSLAATEDSAKSTAISFTNPGSETLGFAVKTQPVNGAVSSFAADGSYTYKPKANYNGTDSFVIQVTDGTKISTQEVTVTVASVNDLPTIAKAADTIAVTEDVAFKGTVSAVDVDTTDATPDVITYTASTATKGVVTIDGKTGAYTYAPNANANGADSFVVTATDKAGEKATQSITVNIASVNDAPTADSIAAKTTPEDSVLAGTMGAKDVDTGDVLTYAVKTQGTKGSVAIAADGSYTYTPTANVNGTDSFVITASDGAETISQTVNVTITPVNDPPVVTASVNVSVNEDQSFTRAIGATDPDTGDVLTYAIKTAPAKGVASVNAAGTVSYSPELNYFGADSIVIEVTDAAGAKSTQTLAVTVAAVNDPPVATSDTASVVGGGSVSTNVLTNDSDVDNDTLTVTSAVAGRGNVTIGTGGVLTYQSMTGDGSSTGVPDTVTYTVSDGKGGTATSTLTVTVFTRTGGSSGNDTLGGSTSAEIINGLAGDDLIDGGGGYDQITAGAGNDTVAFSEDAKFIRGGPDADTLKLSYAGDFRFNLTAANQYLGTTKNAANFAETVTVTDFENIDGSLAQVQVIATGVATGSLLIGGDLNDSLTGGEGNDTLVGGLDADTLTGGSTGSGVDSIIGGLGNDVITSASSISGAQLFGSEGNDTITFNNLNSTSVKAAATIDGGTGSDSIVIGASGSVTGGDGNDTIVIGAGAYSLTVVGGSGNDSIVSDGTADSLQIDAGDNNDTIRVDGNYDSILGGSGNDRIVLTTTGADSTITVVGGQGNDTLIFGLDTANPGDSIVSSAELKFVSGIEFITLGGTGANTVNGSLTISGNSIAGGADLLGINLTGGDTLNLTNFTQTLTINIAGIDQGPASVSANSTTGAIVIVADSLDANDSFSLSGADDTFRDTIAAGVTYNFTNASSIDFIELTGAATVSGTASVAMMSGQSLSLASNANGDSLALSISLASNSTADTLTITGGGWKDTVNLTDVEKAWVYGGDGADSVYIADVADSVYIDGQGGADTLYAGRYDSVYGGSGDDVIVLTANADSTTIIDGGQGADIVRLTTSVSSSALNNLTSIEGIDLTGIGAGALTLTGGSSSPFGTVYIDGDTLTFTNDFGGTGVTSITLSGAGTDSAKVTADSLSDLSLIANSGIGSEDTLNAGNETSPGATYDVIAASISGSQTFDLTNVDNFDQLTISRAATPSGVAVATVSNADSIAITLTSVAADSLALSLSVATGGFVTVTSGVGADTIDFSNARFGNYLTDSASVSTSVEIVNADQLGDSVSDWISVGGGADSIRIDAKDTVYAGTGADTIVSASSGADSLNALYIDADTGGDLISVNGSFDWISAGGDNDLIVLTGRTNLATATVDGGSGVDTVRFADTVSLADSVFANFTNVEVLDLASNGFADVVTLGSAADIAGFTTVLLGEADTISLVGMGATQINLGADASGAFRITADSLTTVTLFADTGAAIGSSDIVQLSTVAGGSDVISIRGAADSTYAFDSSDRGIDQIIVNSATARVVTLTNLGSDSLGGLTVSVASGDTVSTISATVSGADSLTYMFSLGAGSDSIVATTGKLSVVGGNGAESITSGSAADYIDVSGSGAADSDWVSSGSGNDTVITGSGNDTINVLVGVDSVDAGSGDDLVLVTGSGADSLGFDVVFLGAGADSLLVSGTAGAAVNVDLGTGSDSVTLSSKSDTVTHSSSDTSFDVVIAGSGSDYVDLSASSVSGTNIVDLGADSDQFIGGVSADSVNGGDGNDTIRTGGGVDVVYGGSGSDYIDVGGTSAADSNTAFGEDGNDTIIGGALNDTLDGGAGSDRIEAGSGADSVHVGTGSAADYVDLGDGNDIVVLDDNGLASTVNASGFTVYDTLIGGAGANDTVSIATSSAKAISAFDNFGGVSGFEVVAVSGSAGYANTFTMNDAFFDSAISLSFTGAASVSVVNSFVTESGTVTISADTAVDALTITAKAGLTEIASVYASDSLSGDLHFQGDSSDKVVLLGQTKASGQFVMNDVKVGVIELAADTVAPLYDLYFSNATATSGSMVVSIAGATAAADSTRIYWDNSADTIAISIYARNADDVIRTGAGADYISTGSGADSVIAGSGADTIDVGSGANTVRGEAGNDYIIAGLGSDSIDAGSGNDTIQLSGSMVAEVADSANFADLGTGRDWVFGGSGADSIKADADSLGDWIQLYSGSDTVYAGTGHDTIDVSATGSGDSDYVSSGDGNDSVVTGDGNDSVVDGYGFDSIWTGSGNDIVTLNADSAGVDYIYLGVGLDSLYATADSGGVYVSITGGDTGADIIMTGNGNDSIYASIGADSIDAGSGRDTIFAQGIGATADSAGDTVTGGFGADYIDLGLSGAGDTDYLIFGAETLGSSFGAADLAIWQHSSRANLDSVINFDVDGNTAADSVSFDVFRFDFSVLADSVGAGTYLTDGVLSGAAFDAVSGLPASSAGGTLLNAITEAESWLGSDLTAGEVFAFYWSGTWYVAVGANSNNKVGSVVQFVGVSDIDRVIDLGSGVYKLYDDSTMAGPGGV